MAASQTVSLLPITLSKSLSLVCMIMLTIVFTSCSIDQETETETPDVDYAAERETIMTLEREWSGMYGEGDVDGIAELLAEESVLLVPGQPPAIGSDSVLALTRELLAAEEADGVSVSWEPEAVFVSTSGDMAWDYGRATTTMADGSVIMGSYLVVWTKENGEWKIAADIFN